MRSVSKTYSCERCHDNGVWIDADGFGVPCECVKRIAAERRLEGCLIDPAFEVSTFDNYKVMRHNKAMYDAAREYADNFLAIRASRDGNGLGFIAKLGESAIKAKEAKSERYRLKEQHNSYGLGKTHLQTAIAKAVLSQGVQVAMCNDSDIVARLRQAQLNQNGDDLEKLVQSLENAELLIWDDLGKAKTTEWVLNQYYRVFNARYRKGLPTCFSTNEDLDTLSQRIGDAVVSRLCAMCRGRIVACEGPDYRQK